MLRDSHVFTDEHFWHSSAGSRLAFGGKPLEGHSIPEQYGAIEPTAVFVPLQEILKDGNFELVTTEVFGPVQARWTELGTEAVNFETIVPDFLRDSSARRAALQLNAHLGTCA